jgi:hypothetical protein
MKWTLLSSLALASLATASFEGEAKMSHLMSLKMQSRERARASGLFQVNRYMDRGATKCKNGKAGEYSCDNVDLNAFLSHQAMGSVTREGNDIWGV